MDHLVRGSMVVLPLLRLAATYGVHGPAMRDRHDPRLGLAETPVEPGRLAPYLEEHLLRDVLRPCRVTHDAPGEPEHGGRDLVVQPFEGMGVAQCHAPHERVDVDDLVGRHQPQLWLRRHAFLLCRPLSGHLPPMSSHLVRLRRRPGLVTGSSSCPGGVSPRYVEQPPLPTTCTLWEVEVRRGEQARTAVDAARRRTTSISWTCGCAAKVPHASRAISSIGRAADS